MQPNYTPQTFQNYGTVVYTPQQQKAALPNDANHINFSKKIYCRQCNNVVMTRLQYKCGTKALLYSIFCFPCGLISLCSNSCLDVDHYCPHCNSPSGAFKNKCC